MNWEQLISDHRLGKEGSSKERIEYRTQFQRDFDRLIFSAAFRRMQNKTQVFPLPGSVFVHNRLTHSLEVSSVGRSLGTDVGRILSERHGELPSILFDSLGAIVSAACLAHDMGNPPFGHSGEKAICTFFSEGEGERFKSKIREAVWHDITRFDGNANTFRLLTHQFAGHREGGFVMTYSTLASIVKYPWASYYATNHPKFGFFDSEVSDFEEIAAVLGLLKSSGEGEPLRYCRHPLVYLVEAADDICYQVMDIEDAHKLRLLSNEKAEELLLSFFSPEKRVELRNSYEHVTDFNDRIVFYRSCVINLLEQACVKLFVAHEDELLKGTFEGTLMSRLPEPLRAAYANCSKVAREEIYTAKEVTDVDIAGYHIIHTLLSLVTQAVEYPEKAYSQLLLRQASSQYELQAASLEQRLMAVVDYISGMTDVFALDLYRKLTGQSLPQV